jgi:hypothetical protein
MVQEVAAGAEHKEVDNNTTAVTSKVVTRVVAVVAIRAAIRVVSNDSDARYPSQHFGFGGNDQNTLADVLQAALGTSTESSKPVIST